MANQRSAMIAVSTSVSIDDMIQKMISDSEKAEGEMQLLCAHLPGFIAATKTMKFAHYQNICVRMHARL